MVTLRVSALPLLRRALPVARPWFQLKTYYRTSVPPLLRMSAGKTTRYSTVTAKQPARMPTIDRAASKLFRNADEAVADLESGSTILSSGFGLCGVAGNQPWSVFENKV